MTDKESATPRGLPRSYSTMDLSHGLRCNGTCGSRSCVLLNASETAKEDERPKTPPSGGNEHLEMTDKEEVKPRGLPRNYATHDLRHHPGCHGRCGTRGCVERDFEEPPKEEARPKTPPSEGNNRVVFHIGPDPEEENGPEEWHIRMAEIEAGWIATVRLLLSMNSEEDEKETKTDEGTKTAEKDEDTETAEKEPVSKNSEETDVESKRDELVFSLDV